MTERTNKGDLRKKKKLGRKEGRKEGKRARETHQDDVEESESCFIVLLLHDQCSPLILDVGN